MAPAVPYRALSLDLWFTALYYAAGDEAGWRKVRVDVLSDLVRRPDGAPFAPADVRAALEAYQTRVRATGRDPVAIDPEMHVRGVATELGGVVAGGPGEAGRRYSSAGMAEYPPRVNPEATRVARELRRRGVPVIAITNTARRGATWQERLPAWHGPEFEEVVTSCEVGVAKPDPALFAEAARRLDLRPAEILHVGDRPELDLAGARAAGFGAVLYRGFWDRYPDDDYPGRAADQTAAAALGATEAECIDRLEDLLDPDRFAWVPRPARHRGGRD